MYNINRYFSFSKLEISNILLASLIISIIFALKSNSLFLIIKFMALFTIFLLLKVSFQKIIAINLGFSAEYLLNFNWSLFTFIFSFLDAKFFYSGSVETKPLATLRVGKILEHGSIQDLGIISISGIIPFLFLIFVSVKTGLFNEIIVYAYLMVIYSLLPLPYFDGYNLLYGSRIYYILITSLTILTLISFEYSGQLIYSVISGSLLAIICTLIYYFTIELKLS